MRLIPGQRSAERARRPAQRNRQQVIALDAGAPRLRLVNRTAARAEAVPDAYWAARSRQLAGLTRARQFCQDDAHCFVTPEQIGDEVERLLRLVQEVYQDFRLDFSVELSTRPETFLGETETWDQAEDQLKQALDAAGQAYTVATGEGNFYGPKIDFHVVDAIGRTWQCATIQLDYQMPQRFGLKYIGADNAERTPVLIHRAIFGSFERFIAVLIEHFAGRLPVWLAPVQAVVATIVSDADEYAKQAVAKLEAAGIRVESDLRNEKINYKVREHSLAKVPHLLVVGNREAEEGTVAVRTLGEKDQRVMSLDEAIAMLRSAATPPDLR